MVTACVLLQRTIRLRSLLTWSNRNECFCIRLRCSICVRAHGIMHYLDHIRLFLLSRFVWIFFFFSLFFFFFFYRTCICVSKDKIAASVNVKMSNVLCCRNVIIMGEIVRLPVFWLLIRTHTYTHTHARTPARTHTPHVSLYYFCIRELRTINWHWKQCVWLFWAKLKGVDYIIIYLLTRLHSRLEISRTL